MTEELLTVREVARQLRIDESSVRRWIKQGTLEAVRLPHKGRRESFRIKQSTLNKILNPEVPDIL